MSLQLRSGFPSPPRPTRRAGSCARAFTSCCRTRGERLMHEVQSWEEEKRAAYLYRIIAAAEGGTPRESLFRELAAAADSQADIWANTALKSGARVPQH